MPTRPKNAVGDILADARKTIATARSRIGDFKKADAARKVKLLDPAYLAKLAGDLREAERAVGRQSVGKAGTKAATASEAKLRRDVFESLATIRDEVALAHPGDAVARAFGVGKKLDALSTPKLLAAVEAVKAAHAEPESRAAAVAAGVTASRIAALEKLGIKLADADTTQNVRVSARKGATTTKDDVIRSLKAGTARIRKVAKLVFRGKPAILAEFSSTLPRRTPKARRRPAPATPPPA